MFAKIFIFFAVGCTLTLANSQNENKTQALVRHQPRGFFGTLTSWTSKTISIATWPYRKAFNIFFDTTMGVANYGVEKVLQVMHKTYEIKEKFYENLSAIKDQAIQRLIGLLQHIVETWDETAEDITCEEMKKLKNQFNGIGVGEVLVNVENSLKDDVKSLVQNLGEELKAQKEEMNSMIAEKKTL